MVWGAPWLIRPVSCDTARQTACKRLVADLRFQASESFQFLVMSKPTLTNSGFRLRAVALAASCGVLLVGCGGGSTTTNNPMGEPEPTPAELAAQMREREQKADLAAAHTALMKALDDATLNTQEALDAANAAHETLRDAIADAADVSDPDKAEYRDYASTARGRIASAQRIFDAAETTRMEREAEEQRRKDAADAAAMAATAAKLYEGIGDSSTSSSVCHATGGDFNNGGCFFNAPFGDPGDVELSWSGRAIILKEDKDAALADLHGWEGRRYTASPAGGGTYEAVLYSNVEEPKQGEKFSTQYDSTVFTGGTLNEATTEGAAGRVASPSFDHKAGLKRFKLPENNIAVIIPGSYHGVAGAYSCTPGTGTCAASFAGGRAGGFNLGGVDADGFTADKAAWTFRPADANARVMSAPDTQYQSYGWWLYKSADGKTWTGSHAIASEGASQLVNSVVSLPNLTAFRALHGTATYRGGAAGLYAFSSATGGTNDAGHFTARTTLEADFTADTISGTVDEFKGADGLSRNWSVELEKSDFDSHPQFGTLARTVNVPGSWPKTVWTVDGISATAAGGWYGEFYDSGNDGVPKVMMGQIRARWGKEGRMWGAFGANREQ